MPVNAPAEYFKAEEKFHSAKTKEEKIAALEEMIRLLPRHHGSENAHAQLKSRLAKLKKEKAGKKGGRTFSITKEGEAQVCLIGFTNSGKSFLLSKLTDAKPGIAEHPYTTTKPEVGMMDYRGVKIQIIEIPSTFDSKYMSIARTCDAVALVIRGQMEIGDLKKVLEGSFIRTKAIFVNPFHETSEEIKERIWRSLDLIVVYTKKGRTLSPMALPTGSAVRDFAQRIHKDFVRDFRFARVFRKENSRERIIQAGIGYKLLDGDAIEIHTK